MRPSAQIWARWLMPLCMMCAAHGQTSAISAWFDFHGQIPGESTDSSHPNWIDVMSLGLDGKFGGTGSAGFTFTKKLDKASPLLFRACAAATIYPEAILDLRNANLLPTPLRARLGFEGVKILSHTTGGALGDANPTEVVEIGFTKVTYIYILADGSSSLTDYNYTSLSGTMGTGTAADIDNDGMPDSWETTFNLSVGINDSAGDVDGDGLSNLNEYLLGTNPQSGTSFFQATLTPVSGSTTDYHLTWTSVAGKSYIVEWSPDLGVPFGTLQTVTATAVSTTITVTRAATVGFYRVRPAP